MGNIQALPFSLTERTLLTKLSGTACLYGAVYYIQGGFSRLLPFIEQFSEHLDRLPFDPSAVRLVLEKKCAQLEEFSGQVDQKIALQLLIARDLRQILNVLESDKLRNEIVRELPFEENLRNCLSQGINLLRQLGLELAKPDIFIVDAVPAPYDKAEYKALATDDDDLQQHGIRPGLYFVRHHLRPVYSRSLLLHEMIHPLAAQPNPFLLGRGLEEGLAELVGSMYLSAKILGRELANNIFRYTRLKYGFDQFWDLYLDYTRQAAYLYDRFGLDGIAAVLRGGRKRIKEVEGLLLRGRLEDLDLPAGNWDDDLTNIANSTTMTFCRNLVVSPLAKYLLPFVVKGKSISEILKTANAERDEGTAAIRELQSRVVLAVVTDDLKISLSDAELLAGGSLVRYEIPHQ